MSLVTFSKSQFSDLTVGINLGYFCIKVSVFYFWELLMVHFRNQIEMQERPGGFGVLLAP